MNKKRLLLTGVILLAFLVSACTTHQHIVGDGSQTGIENSKRQLWLVAGLVPLNDVDTRAMAGNANDYEITTKMTFVDALITGFTYNILQSRTVTVRK